MLCADSLPVFKGLEASLDSFGSVIKSPPATANSLGINPFQLMNEKTPEKRRPTTDQQPKSPAIRFNLEAVYQRIYGESPQVAHNAEADVLTLLLSAIATPADFVSRVDNTAIPFDTIKKCW